MSDLDLSTPLATWVYLNRVVEGPSASLQALLEHHSAEEIAHGIYHRADWIGPLLARTASRFDWVRQKEDLAAAERVGARLITADSPEWPAEAFSSAFGFYQNGADAPATFDEQAVPPHSLWVRGSALKPEVGQAVGIVGTRAISRYGWQATQSVVSGLVNHQWTIVSGGALGVDTVAHETALHNAGRTIAVAACGIDKNYPARNGGLFDQIADNGCIVSEFAPETAPKRHRFLIRNRLVAALSQGIVVMEAAYRSGALNTLNWAEALGRVAMAVPGPITTSGSLGCHQRIQDGRAQLVASADEVRALVGRAGTVDPEAQYEMNFAASLTQRLSRDELRVFDATPPPGSPPATAEDIARDAGFRLPLTVHLLLALEKMCVIVREGNNWVRLEMG